MEWKFWRWFFLGLNDRSGIRELFVNCSCVVHIFIGVILAWGIEVCLHDAARTILLPLAGIFVGLSFAWAGNAQALIQEDEIRKIAVYLPDGIETYIYTFQMAILVILVTLGAWGLAGLEVFSIWIFQSPFARLLVEICLYFLASLTLRECWHVVLGSQMLILTRYYVRKVENEKECREYLQSKRTKSPVDKPP